MQKLRGDLIAGRFIRAGGQPIVSVDPANGGAVVARGEWHIEHVEHAVAAAVDAQRDWRQRSLADRFAALTRWRTTLQDRSAEIAAAIVAETGKITSEARAEAGSLVARFALVHGQAQALLQDATRTSTPNAELRWHPHGVVGVIGPFNYPLHLCHAHALPALLMGNAVVIKPSETTLLCGQLYAETALAAGLPDGLINVVQGPGEVGAALAADARVRGLCFTGSWHTGRQILAASLDRPELLVALEMGGKNTAIVCADADLRQAAHEIVVGGYLTAGQRCTCTERVLVHREVADSLRGHLAHIVSNLTFAQPDDPDAFAGPLTTLAGKQRFDATIARARASGARVIATGRAPDGPFFAAPTLHETDGDIAGYTDTELFGPDVALTAVQDDDEALVRLKNSPFGLAAAVFTASTERYERLAGSIHAGLVHHNRTTNQASGALPFGGVGRSGNFRPAGSFAVRNTAYPIAVMRQPTGALVVDERIAALLPGPDLIALAARHDAESTAEDARGALGRARPLTIVRPAGGHLPVSDDWLERLYAGNRMAREKKPGVFDHARSFGPFMCSVDDEALCVLDAMSQTATLADGFAPDAVVAALHQGAFDGLLHHNPESADHPAAEAYREQLRSTVAGLPEVTFTNSGAEANEKAIALAALHAPPGTRRVLAFEGSFHGRTLLALHATWNPTKRQPFEMPGFAVTFAPMPHATRWAHDREKADPAGLLEAMAQADLAAARAQLVGQSPELDAELDALAVVDAALSETPYVAVLVEPMQSEGGDRYASGRFHRCLRLLTRAHGVALIVDEVQCGFGLSGPFAWHSRFRYVDADGKQDFPDAVTFAKRAQVGVVMSRWSDPEPTASHVASLVRGRLHARLCADTDDGARVQAKVRPLLTDLQRRFPELIGEPRALGFAFAFDLADASDLPRWIGQRFWRGAVVFAAGQRTVRYRLSRAFSDADIDRLFEAMRESAAWLVAHPGEQPPVWHEPPISPKNRHESAITVRRADPSEADVLLDAIMAIEAEVYEPVRRDTREHLATAFEAGGIAIVAQDSAGHVVGSTLAAPLERFEHVQGCGGDPTFGEGTTLYSAATTVAPSAHGQGIGMRLKAAQLDAARPAFRFITGRNRVGETAAMNRLVRRLGGANVAELTGQYEGGGRARYYKIPTGGLTSLEHAAVTKITICNYVSPPIVRAIEYLCAAVPQLPHLYLTSSRDELVDKALRLFRWRRNDAQIGVTFAGSYFGHTTAAARSLSDPRLHKMGEPWLDWPRLPHPADIGSERACELLRETLLRVGPERVLAIAIDPAGERSGTAIPADFWPLLAAVRAEFDVPLLVLDGRFAEDPATGGPFAMPAAITPDIFGWWTGAQAGLLHVSARWFEAKPLTFVSTWDGDELSLIRAQRQVRRVVEQT